MNIEEIKELRERTEELRRDVARLHGQVDELEYFFNRALYESDALTQGQPTPKIYLHGLKEMAQAYNSLLELGSVPPFVYMHSENLELYERWQTENSPYKHMVGYFKGSRIWEEEHCPKGSVIFTRGGRTISVQISFEVL